MATSEYENGRLLPYRVTQLEKELDGLEKKLDRVQATLNKLLFTIAAGSIGVTLSVLIGSGKI